MEKYHYDPEEYPNLKRLAGEMIPCLETEAGWQDREIKETFPGRDQSFLAVGITLGKGIDALQEKYLQKGFLTESYMIEVLSSELLLESYRAYTEWVVVHRNLHVARLHFLGGEISETSEQKISSLLRLANLPMLLQELALPVTCNAAYCMIPKKCGILCGADEGSFYQMCRNLSGVRQERLPRPWNRPLSYGYARIFSKAQMKINVQKTLIGRNIKILIRFIRRLVSKKRIWYDAIAFKEERYRVCGVSCLG